MYNNYIICNEYFLENIAHVHIILYVSLIKVTLKIKKKQPLLFWNHVWYKDLFTDIFEAKKKYKKKHLPVKKVCNYNR